MKKYLTFCIILLTLSLFSCSVCNAESDYIRNFNKKYTYTQNQFEDVNSEWFASAVQQTYETGLMNGESKTTFNPNGNIDNAAVITIAARLHSIYNYGTDEFNTDTSIWYEPYINYAVSKGICDSGIDVNAISTRSFFAGIIGNAIDTNIFDTKNVIADGALSDVTGWYANSVYTFYRAGVLSGNDQYGTFSPDTPITRAEVAAILSRIVRPSERVSVVLKSRPIGTYSIMQDDGSLEAFKQRALVANFKVLIGGEEKSSDWENDKYYIHHSGISGIPSETIIIPEKYIDSRYSDIYNDNVIVFKNSWVNPNLSGETTIPIYYFKYGLPIQIGSKTYNLSVVNTGGEVDFYGGIIINGDLKLYYPGKTGTGSWTETISYNNYTAEAQKMISSVAANKLTLNEGEIKAYINNVYPQYKANEESDYIAEMTKVCVGYLTDWENRWYLTVNRENMCKPSKREGQINWLTQYEFVFEPTEEKTIQWCKKNFGKYVIALVVDFNGEPPIVMAEISGYNDTTNEREIRTWSYTNGILDFEYKNLKDSFVNPIILSDNRRFDIFKEAKNSFEIQENIIDNDDESMTYDTTGLTKIVNHGGKWRFSYDNDREHEFFVSVRGNDIIVVSTEEYSRNSIPLSRFVKLSKNSTSAIVGELRPHYGNRFILDDFDNIITQKKATAPVETRVIDGDVYVPAEFLIENLY